MDNYGLKLLINAAKEIQGNIDRNDEQMEKLQRHVSCAMKENELLQDQLNDIKAVLAANNINLVLEVN